MTPALVAIRPAATARAESGWVLWPQVVVSGGKVPLDDK